MSEFHIAHTWDGLPVKNAPTVRLSWSAEHLHVAIASPKFGANDVDGPPQRHWRLWEHEVVELFIAGPGAAPKYIELELAPTGHWLALRLHGTRNIIDDDVPVSASAVDHGTHWEGQLTIGRDQLPAGPLRVLATAAHGPPECRRHLAHVPLPGPEPDFHQLDRFTALPTAAL